MICFNKNFEINEMLKMKAEIACLFRMTVIKVRDFNFHVLTVKEWTQWTMTKKWCEVNFFFDLQLFAGGFYLFFIYVSLSQIKQMADYLQFVIHTIIAISL